MTSKKDGELLAGVDTTHSIDLMLINSPLKNYDFSPRYNDFTLPVLGLGYIATYARQAGFNVAVLDAEALGLGISRIAALCCQDPAGTRVRRRRTAFHSRSVKISMHSSKNYTDGSFLLISLQKSLP